MTLVSFIGINTAADRNIRREVGLRGIYPEKERNKNVDVLGRDKIVAAKDKILSAIKSAEDEGGISLVLQSLTTDRRLNCRIAPDGSTCSAIRIDERMEAVLEEIGHMGEGYRPNTEKLRKRFL